jgi:hypothetical protein
MSQPRREWTELDQMLERANNAEMVVERLRELVRKHLNDTEPSVLAAAAWAILTNEVSR